VKKSIIILVALCGVIACAVVLLNRQNSLSRASEPVVEPNPPQTSSNGTENTDVSKPEAPQMVSDQTAGLAADASAKPMPAEVKQASPAAELSRTVDALLSDKTSFSDRQAIWKKLKAAGMLDQVVAELKQRAAGSPDDAAIPTAIGEALMNKFPIADPDESAMNGLQMDQSFNKALKLDPANWEAQFFKATELSYWPADMNKAPEVVQRFSALIDQQETMASQPEFAQTYVFLGNEYQKIGQPETAAATWQIGLTKFPNDPTLQKKISGQ
jgi:tetratricopeptide (TPR) repeat protein